MIQMVVRIATSLDGATPLTEADRDTTTPTVPGVAVFAPTGDVGRFSPALVFPAGQEVQGWRFDFAHVIQQTAGTVVAAEIEDGAGNAIDSASDFVDLTLTNTSRFGPNLIIPQGYVVRLASDGTVPMTVRLGFTPLITPVDLELVAAPSPPPA